VLSIILKNSNFVPKKDEIVEPVLSSVLLASSTCEIEVRKKVL